MANPKLLSNKDRTMMKAFGKAGDIFARAVENFINNDGNRATLLAAGTAVSTKGATTIHAAIRGDTAITAVTTGLTNPTVPRNVLVTFGANWDGGNITVVGTREGAAVTETLLSNAGSTRVGVKIFDTVTSVLHTVLGTDADVSNTYSLGDGDKLGIPKTTLPAAGSPVLLFTSGVAEAVTYDATYNAFTPTNVPNSSRSYVLSFNQ